MPHYAIGDIHGCYAQLLRLLDKIQFSESKDVLWFTGDLVNRGPDSLGTLRFIKQLKQSVVVLGNHDLFLLGQLLAGASQGSNEELNPIFKASDRDELGDWLRQRPLFHHDDQLGYTLVHAGLPPGWGLKAAQGYASEVEELLKEEPCLELFKFYDKEDPVLWKEELQGWPRWRLIIRYFTFLRFCDLEGRLDLVNVSSDANVPGYYPWFKISHRKSRELNLIFGHWSSLKGKTGEPNVHALDTGCVWGHALTAMRLEDAQRFSVS